MQFMMHLLSWRQAHHPFSTCYRSSVSMPRLQSDSRRPDDRTEDHEMRGGPVSRILFPGSPRFDDHSSCDPVTRTAPAANPDLLGQKRPRLAARGPYLALLPVGLAVPPLLPAARWALTPPFHPCPSPVSAARPCGGWSVFCGAFRRVAPPGRYPAPSLFGVRTFLCRGPTAAAIRSSAHGATCAQTRPSSMGAYRANCQTVTFRGGKRA
jgi:hypothetical protein